MKFTLKDYQSEAVAKVLTNLKKARRRWHEEAEKNAFSLTATTGAGKTVMAAAVFEALFFGDDDHDFDPDPGAVVLWFSDDPSLNQQSRFRLQESSDKLNVNHLRTVENTFDRPKFEPRKIYFLNTQKLSKKSLLVRGAEAERLPGIEEEQISLPMPDLRAHTIWDTIQNTIEDRDLTLYLILDEAHRGMKEVTAGAAEGRTTIVKRLINGTRGVPGIPVVWGISATVERFNNAVAGMEGRSSLANVVVDSKKVQESGLLKDTINLDIPDEDGEFSTVLVRRGTDKFREISEAWEKYAKDQDDIDAVHPLMVLQVPNAPDPDEIGKWLKTIFDRWPGLPVGCVANVFGEHKIENFSGYSVPYIEPERVQESDWVRILIAKDAISTGWDCPRAEVMVSLRAASDRTHITQLLGRMVRSPLARRIPGNERLNSVDCLLPYFNRAAVTAVVNSLKTGEDAGDGLTGRRVLIKPQEMTPNPAVPDAVFELFISLPSQALPKRQAKPVKRLTSLAHELAADGLLPDAGKIVHAELHKVLDAARVRYDDKIEEQKSAVLTVEGKTVRTTVGTTEMTFNDFVEQADYAVIEDSYKRAARMFTADVARTYSEHLAAKNAEEDDPVDALIDAHTVVASMGFVADIKDDLEREATKLSDKYLADYRIQIRSLTDERQDVYREIKEMSAEPVDVDLARPTSSLDATTSREADGAELLLPKFEKHLLCDKDGLFPADLDSWEEDVLKSELARGNFIAWYRNPGSAKQESLGIIYEDGVELATLRPDFIFFGKDNQGKYVADIVDPHSFHLADALPKLKGLAKYAETHASSFRRIEAIAFLNDKYKVIDLMDTGVRESVMTAASAKALYDSSVAANYDLA